MRVVVSGGAGFLGSHLCEALLDRGDHVVCLDDLSTASLDNLAHLLDRQNLEVVQTDVSDEVDVAGPVDVVAHLASPASPPDYHRLPLETLAVGSRGTENMSGWLTATGRGSYSPPPARSTATPGASSNGRTIGATSIPSGRAVSTTRPSGSPRLVDGLPAQPGRQCRPDADLQHLRSPDAPARWPGGVQFHHAGPQRAAADYLRGGSQTRSFCYVDDLIRGIIAMLDCDEPGPVNLGNPTEHTVAELAELVLRITGSLSTLEHHLLPIDDPTRRLPSIVRAQERLGWRPGVPIEEGLRRTVKWFRSRPRQVAAAAALVAGAQDQGSPSVDVRGVVGDRAQVTRRRAIARSAGATLHPAHIATAQ